MNRKDRSAKLHKESVIIDGLNASVWNKEVFERLRQGGVTAINATTACWENFRNAIENIEKWNRKFETYGDIITQVRTVGDVKRAKTETKLGIILGFQNITPIEDDVGLLKVFWDLGVRVIQLTFQDRNLAGDGCWERTDAGLSEFGFKVVKELNRQGILIDLSHSGDKTTMDAVGASSKPVAFTHSNPRSLKDSKRNKTDEQMSALAKKGGVVGATLYPPVLASGYKSSIDHYLDVIEYLVKLIGVDHVALGTDFTEFQTKDFFVDALTGKSWDSPLVELDYPVIYPKGIRSATDLPNITKGLSKRGYSETEIKKIMGENWIRIYSEVWKT